MNFEPEFSHFKSENLGFFLMSKSHKIFKKLRRNSSTLKSMTSKIFITKYNTHINKYCALRKRRVREVQFMSGCENTEKNTVMKILHTRPMNEKSRSLIIVVVLSAKKKN